MMSGTMLHVGCGGDNIPEWAHGCTQTRLDIDPKHKPDIVADITNMGDIGPFDMVYSCHVLEHLYQDDVDKALQECLRVLKPGGAFMAFVPDLEGVQATTEVLYMSPAGPVCGLDMIYGMKELVEDTRYMAHHTGFVSETLQKCLEKAGFESVSVQRCSVCNLFGVGKKPM